MQELMMPYAKQFKRQCWRPIQLRKGAIVGAECAHGHDLPEWEIWAGTRAYLIRMRRDCKMEVLDRLVYEAFCERNHIRSPGQVLVRADALRAVNGFDVKIKGADDWELWIRLAKLGRFRYENRIAFNCRNHSGNASRNVWAMYANCMRVVKKHFSSESERYRVAKRNVRSYAALGFFDAGQWHLWSGHRMLALKSFAIAAVFDPKMVLSRARKVLTAQLLKRRYGLIRPNE